MASDPDRLILSAKERQVLAELEASLQRDDPDLEASLATGRRRRISPRATGAGIRRRWAALTPPMALTASAALVVAGMAVMIATFTRWLPLALVGAAMQAAGMAGGLDAIRRLWARRAKAG